MARRKGADPLPDHYAALQVHPGARPEVIKAAYRALMGIHHPDKGASGRVAKALNEAHDVLSDADKRRRYDREREASSGDLVGNYEVLERIAEGGFGATYKARHILNGEPACVKFCTNVPPEYYDLLLAESKVIWDLRHYAMPAVRDIVKQADGGYALVMSYVEGPTLAQIVEKSGRLDAEHVAWITDRVLNALKYLHYHGVVHGDVKPQNIIVQPRKHMAVLVDFGLSEVRPTRTTEAKGYTELFAPPEQMAGKPILPESDFYSLGITMLWALSGGDAGEVQRRRVPSDLPKEVGGFIRKLIVNDVRQRPRWPEEPNETDLIDELREVRRTAFGRERSSMRPIKGFEKY
ncbi:MAG TPA: protein kinase [Candidatus Paceibacterota bacterium]|nr:protein kinase [Candidatus Paceibacterota bacterium]